jgi:hypothetical protein
MKDSGMMTSKMMTFGDDEADVGANERRQVIM